MAVAPVYQYMTGLLCWEERGGIDVLMASKSLTNLCTQPGCERITPPLLPETPIYHPSIKFLSLSRLCTGGGTPPNQNRKKMNLEFQMLKNKHRYLLLNKSGYI